MVEMDKEQTLTVFRKWIKKPDYAKGDILALFPEIIADPDKNILCYQHIGQHGSAKYWWCISQSIPASPDEYADLKEELESIGYILKIRKRWTRPRK